MKPTPEDYLAAVMRIQQLSPAPRVLCRALALLRDPNCDVTDVVALIKVDTALTAEIIRGANSAFYGSGSQVSSLDRAVQKIGFRESVRLLNLAVTRVFAARDLGSYGISAEAFWSESLFHGLLLQELASATAGFDVDVANTAGLLRYIGRLAINQSIADLGGGLFWDGTLTLAEWENANVGFTQDHAAALLLRGWSFPEELCTAIEHQSAVSQDVPASWLHEALGFAAAAVPPGTWYKAAKPIAPPPGAFASRHGLTANDIASFLEAACVKYEAITYRLYD